MPTSPRRTPSTNKSPPAETGRVYLFHVSRARLIRELETPEQAQAFADGFNEMEGAAIQMRRFSRAAFVVAFADRFGAIRVKRKKPKARKPNGASKSPTATSKRRPKATGAKL